MNRWEVNNFFLRMKFGLTGVLVLRPSLEESRRGCGTECRQIAGAKGPCARDAGAKAEIAEGQSAKV